LRLDAAGLPSSFFGFIFAQGADFSQPSPFPLHSQTSGFLLIAKSVTEPARFIPMDIAKER
jgi:hypothetical protein